ncbi:hypothetical protein B0J13DRAFT_593379 [Dactylonectria estremocensis]|uniref:Pre-rRNA processing protein n=1 Tax=Dactylonectria estremocensis TaxID=1079267 RepID=A0A9P9F7E7_9HYPO|nr:hypothetical protein B0J13DRAFT_593379 [Dactylonectria estremocensis]
MSAPDERTPLISSDRADAGTESSPLLGNHDNHDGETNGSTSIPPAKAWSLWPWSKKYGAKPESPLRWPSIIAMTILAMLIILIIFLGFIVPPAVQKYAENAAVLEPTNLSIENITSTGIWARVQANVRLEGSRVEDKNYRRIGRAVTGLMRKLETDETTVDVFLPDYGDALAGTAVIPSLVLDIVDGHTTELNFVTKIQPGAAENIRKIANDWLDGKLDQLRVVGKTKVQLKSGIFPLGAHNVAETMVFEATDIPSLPAYKIERLDLHDVPVDGTGRKAIQADVSVTVHNNFPVSLEVPSLGFEILVPNCDSSLPSISVADATTDIVKVRANKDVKADAQGIIREIPESLTRVCPHSKSSPLDEFMEHYLHGQDAQVFVRGKRSNNSDTPEWISEILESITVPIDFPGRSFDSFIRNFSITDVDFKLPDPFADAKDPNSEPRISGTTEVLAVVPPELNVDLGVDSLRATADLSYEKRKFGVLHLNHWERANSTKVDSEGDENLLKITSRVVDVPLTITDSDVFSEVMQKLLFGDEDLTLDVKATVDVRVSTVLGILTIKNVPAEGKIPVNGLPGDAFAQLNPQVGEIQILNTSETGVHLQALVNITNPTEYTAVVPYINIHILHKGEILGEAVATNIDFGLAHKIGRKLLSDYVSGKNTTMTAKAHRNSIPTVPQIGEALSRFNFTIPTPRIRIPGEDDDARQRFIADATFHIFSSSATFTLVSPLQFNTLYIEHINATAFYNHTEPVGQIVHDESFAAPPGRSQTPRLPVQWSPDHVGYDKLRKALGGTLKLDAIADVTVRLGNWVEEIHYTGEGIGAKVSL